MLRFFRQIRKSLIGQSKVSKYLLYAVGEILLVVIGILIALQVDTWNENKKNTAETRFQILKLMDNLRADQDQLKGAISQNEYYLEDLIFCVNVLSNDTMATKSDFMERFQHMTVTLDFAPTRGAFEGLISSGKIQLITNQSLLDDLFTYYNTSSYVSWDSSIKDYARNVISPYLMNFDHLPNITDKREGLGFTQFDISKFSIPGKSNTDYKNDQFILNALRLKIQLFEGQKIQYVALLKEIEALIGKLDMELIR